MIWDWIFCQNNPNPQKGFQILSPNPKSEDFLDFLDPSVQSFQPLLYDQMPHPVLLGWVDFDVSHCLADSAWADANGNLAELAVHLDKIVEHPNQSQPTSCPTL